LTILRHCKTIAHWVRSFHISSVSMERTKGSSLLGIDKTVGQERCARDTTLDFEAGSPKAKLANEKPQGETVDDDKLIEAWRMGKVK
jgi:hypothetical protein